MRIRGIFSFLVATLLSAGPALGSPIVPETIPGPRWEGPQLVQADRAGNIFFFRGNTLQVYPIDRGGIFADPIRLETTAEDAGLVHDAVLSPGGDQWLIYADFSVRRFVGGKEKPLPPLEWNPWGIGFVRDTPVVAVIPRPMGRVRDLNTVGDVPWLLTLDGDRWNPLTTLKGVSVAKLRENGGMNDVIADRAVFLAGDRQGRLWAARQYAYRVQRLSPGGRVLTEITVDSGEVRKKRESKGIDIKLHGANDNPVEATRNPRTEKGTYYPFTAEAVILDLTEGRDGRLYFLVRTAEGGAALDRYDPGRSALERAPLQMKVPGVFTIAAGRDALYLAAWNTEKGRWRIPWEVLEQAQWKAVEGAEIDGLRVAEQPAAGGGQPGGKADPR